LASHTGRTEEVIGKDTERDNFMSADESMEYGIIDQVLTSRANPEDKEGDK
jgi:ATP-dependent Clp protease protease subunit